MQPPLDRQRRSWQPLSSAQARPGAGQQQQPTQHAGSRPINVLVACLLVLVALPAAAAQPLNGNITTAPDDVAALTGVWGDLRPYTGSALATWQPELDPCTGAWKGVVCSCGDLPIRSLAVACQSTFNSSAAAHHRVLGLDLGPMVNAGGQKLQGRINAALGNLQELRFVDLSNNELTGPLPDTLSRLTKLQWLLLDSNQLSGALPQYLGALPDLKQAQLQYNNFSGPVPGAGGWCTGQAVFDVAHNPLLCGHVPQCLQAPSYRINDIDGTYLMMGLDASSTGGECDSTPPDCDADVGCVIWTPKYWTSRSLVNFNFTGFIDYESGISHYQWGIGSKPYIADVVPPTPVTASRVLKDIRYSGGTKKMFVAPTMYNMSTVSLLEGQSYYVTVVAWNRAGPPTSVNTTSEPVLVDTTGPVPGTVYNTLSLQQASSTTLTQSLQASWENFTDAQSGVTGYVVQFLQQATKDGNATLKPLTEPLSVKPDTNKLQVKAAAALKEGTIYTAQVTATNGAGLTTTAMAMPITVLPTGDGTVSAQNAALIGVLCSLGCLAIGALLAVYFMQQRVRQAKKHEKRRAEDAKQLKALMYALSSQGDMPAGHAGSVSMPPQRKAGDLPGNEVGFVFTDIESSTELSQQDPDAFKQVQEVHDQLMREGIAKHGGYEITTEGDSFQVAFNSCHAAMAFCLDIQYRLLEQTWPKQVLALNACRVIRDPETGQPLFAGARVRMGVHWAREGTVAMRLHNLTRHKVFAGPAIQVVADANESAYGGQIVLTEEAVLKLTEDMSQAGFPVIRLAGLYQLPCVPSPSFMYTVTEIVGKPLRRSFAGLRKIKQHWPSPGAGLPAVLEYNIGVAPMPNDTNALVFVCLRLCTYPKDRKVDLPTALACKLTEVFGISAQQFKGYLFEPHPRAFREGLWAVAFQHSMDALRFSHAAQMLLMYVHWPPAAREYSGPEVPSPDGRWLFMGPRVCMAIHESPDFFASDDPGIDPDAARRAICFAGPAVTLPLVLTYAGRGGQVILSEQAWDSVKPVITQHPGAVSIISLGMHVLSDDFPTPMLLMEVMPNLLARRNFSRITTKKQVEPGFRDAPDPTKPMTVVFMKVNKPQEVADAEKGCGGWIQGDYAQGNAIQAYQLAVGSYATLARKLLRRYDGYECKEPEPGKFTLAFSDLSQAIRWACHLQEELMYLDWPEELDTLGSCRADYDSDGNLIWRGLRVRIGMAWGMVSTQKPLNTGRADYFGVLANGAARVMALASPGQVLIEACNPPLGEDGKLVLQQDRSTYIQLMYTPGSHHHHHKLQDAIADAERAAASLEPAPDLRRVVIKPLGYYLLRGLDNPRLLYDAATTRLRNRCLTITADMWAPPIGTINTSIMNGSFASSRDSFRRNWSSWVERTRTNLAPKRLSPRNSSSPTSSSEAFSSMTAGRKGPGLFRSQSPPATIRSSGSYSIAAGTSPGGHGFRLGSAGGPAGMLGHGHGPFARGTVSEAGRAGLAFATSSFGGLRGSPGATSAGSFGRPASPAVFRSSRSESAAAGRGFSGAGGFHELPVVVNAAVSEDESGGTPSAAGPRLTRNALWLARNRGAGGVGTGGQPAAPAAAAAAAVGGYDRSTGAAGLASLAVPGDASKGLVPTTWDSPGVNDPLLGILHIPPIHIMAAPEAADSGDSPASLGGAADGADSEDPFTAMQSSPSGSPVTARPNGMGKPSQQQPRQQLQQQQRRRSAQMLEHSSGGMCPPSVDPSAVSECPQPWEQQKESWHERQPPPPHNQQQWQPGDGFLGGSSSNGGGLNRQGSTTPVSLSTTMTSCMDEDPLTSAQAQQQQALADAQRLADRVDSEAAMSVTGAAFGMKQILAAAVSGAKPRLSGGSGGGAPKQSWKGLWGKLRRHSTSSAPSAYDLPPWRLGCTATGHAPPGDDDELDEDGMDGPVEAVRQQHGMLPRASNPQSSASRTPISSAPGSRAGTGGGADQLMSPNTVFAQQLQHSYDMTNGRRSSGATNVGSHGGRGAGSYTFAECSYSPKHCRGSAYLDPVAVWQGYPNQRDLVAQQQRQGELASRASGPQLSVELSLRAASGSSSAAAAAAAVEAADMAAGAAAAVDATEVVPQLQQEGQQLQQQQHSDVFLRSYEQAQQQLAELQGTYPAAAAAPSARLSMQDAVAQRLSESMWHSADGSRPQLEAGQLQQQLLLLHQMMQEALAVQSQRPGSAGPTLYPSVLEQLSYRPDTPGTAVRLAADGGPSFIAHSTSRDLRDASVHQPLQPQQQQQQRHHQGRVVPEQAMLAGQMLHAQQAGVPVYSADEYKAHVLLDRAERASRNVGQLPAVPTPQQQGMQPGMLREMQCLAAEPWSSHEELQAQVLPHALAQQMQPQQYEVPRGGSARSPRGATAQERQQVLQAAGEQEPLCTSPQWGLQPAGGLQPPASPQRPSQSQLQPAQQAAQLLHVQAPQVTSRPSPLGKHAAKGAQQASSSGLPSSSRAVPFGQQGFVASGSSTAAAGQGLAGAAVAPCLQSVAVNAKRVIARPAGDAAAVNSPRGTGLNWAGPDFAASGRASSSSAGTSPSSPAKWNALMLQAGMGLPAALPAELPPGGSRGSSGNASPRYASAASSLQGVPSNAMSQQSFVGSSAQCSPRASLPTTPRSMQRAALGAASFGSVAAGAPGSPVAGGSPFLQRAGSSSSCGSPRFGLSAAAQAWAVAGGGRAGDAAALDSEDAEDEEGAYFGPAASPGCRARTPSCSLQAGPKEALGAIPELPPAFESRTSDPSSDKA